MGLRRYKLIVNSSIIRNRLSKKRNYQQPKPQSLYSIGIQTTLHYTKKGSTMETILIIALVTITVWYLGKPLNAVIAGSAEMGSDEFAVLRREQKIRLHKERAKQTTKVQDLAELDVMNDKEFEDFFKVMKGNKDD